MHRSSAENILLNSDEPQVDSIGEEDLSETSETSAFNRELAEPPVVVTSG